MVKKTVNFDAPDVYHLYFGDEAGAPGLDPHVLRVPGRRARPARRRAWSTGSQWRVASDASIAFWGDRLAREGVAARGRDGELRFEDPEGLRHALVVADVPDPPLRADCARRPAPTTRCRASTACAPTRARPTPAAPCSRRWASTAPTATAPGALTGEPPPGGAALRPGTRRRARPAGRGHGPPRRLERRRRRGARRVPRARRGRGRASDAHHRPPVLPLRLLPRARAASSSSWPRATSASTLDEAPDVPRPGAEAPAAARGQRAELERRLRPLPDPRGSRRRPRAPGSGGRRGGRRSRAAPQPHELACRARPGARVGGVGVDATAARRGRAPGRTARVAPWILDVHEAVGADRAVGRDPPAGRRPGPPSWSMSPRGRGLPVSCRMGRRVRGRVAREGQQRAAVDGRPRGRAPAASRIVGARSVLATSSPRDRARRDAGAADQQRHARGRLVGEVLALGMRCSPWKKPLSEVKMMRSVEPPGARSARRSRRPPRRRPAATPAGAVARVDARAAAAAVSGGRPADVGGLVGDVGLVEGRRRAAAARWRTPRRGAAPGARGLAVRPGGRPPRAGPGTPARGRTGVPSARGGGWSRRLVAVDVGLVQRAGPRRRSRRTGDVAVLVQACSRTSGTCSSTGRASRSSPAALAAGVRAP